jgi:hypothetical protein
MSTLILAAGTQNRWAHALPVYVPQVKQLVVIGGEPLIVKIQRQFKESIVVTHRDEIRLHSTMYYKPENHRYLLETLYNTTDLWKSKVTILLGDVLYRTKAIKKIQECKELMFFGNNVEIFALVFMPKDYEGLKVALSSLIILSVTGEIRGKLWHLYRHLNNIPLNEHSIKGKFTKIIDGTRDFDNYEQYKRYAQRKEV